MAGVHDPDTATEIDEPISIGIRNQGTLGINDRDRRYRGNTSWDRFGAPDKQSAAPGPRNFGSESNRGRH